jgi:hypothetical protein
MDALSRALVGFDQMFDQMERRYSSSVSNNYPPQTSFVPMKIDMKFN